MNRFLVLSLGLLALLPGMASATTVSIVFPALVGNYSYPDQAANQGFDLGVQFSAISAASLEVTATGTAGIMKTCLIGNPLDCQTSSFGPQASYSFALESGYGFPPFGSFSPFSATSQTYTENLIQPLHPMDFLLDGQGVLRFGHTGVAVALTHTLEILTPSEFDVSEVRLTIEGTAVPLPAALPLMMAGLTGVGIFGFGFRKKGAGQTARER